MAVLEQDSDIAQSAANVSAGPRQFAALRQSLNVVARRSCGNQYARLLVHCKYPDATNAEGIDHGTRNAKAGVHYSRSIASGSGQTRYCCRQRGLRAGSGRVVRERRNRRDRSHCPHNIGIILMENASKVQLVVPPRRRFPVAAVLASGFAR